MDCITRPARRIQKMEDATKLKETLLAAAVEQDGRMTLPCAEAFRVAHQTGTSLEAVGKACNEHKIKIVHCQLGCFK